MNPDIPKTDRLLGSGSAGSVYLAHGEGGTFALKVLKDLSPISVANFEREVFFLSKLRHPGLVAVHGFSKTGPSYWMDFIDGEPIDAAAKRRPEKIADWLSEGLEALDYLHGQGVLHGDLKPANILIDRDGRAKLLDFGLASLAASSEPAGKLRGSLPYLAPESLNGERFPASDLYALGTVFHEILAGRHPRANAESLEKLFSSDFRRLEESGSKLTPRVARILDRMIETDRSVRFKTARDVLSALRGDEIPAGAGSHQTFQVIGREKEWSAAVKFVETRGKAGGLLAIRGLTGTGKTRFARELYFHIGLRGLSADRRGDLETPTASERRELYAHLQKEGPAAFLILEVNDDRLTSEGAGFFAALAEEGGVLEITLSPEGFQDPARVETESLLKRRLKKLDDADLRLLRALSASEGPVPPAALADVSDASPLAVSEGLSRLKALGLARSHADDRFEISSLRIAELAFEDSSEDRRRIHARWIEHWEPAGDAVLLAPHALELEDHPKRQAWVLEATQTLEDRGSLDSAVLLYEKALALNPTFSQREDLLRGLANILGAKGDFSASLRVLEEWFREFPNDPDGLNPVKYGLATGVAYKNLGDFQEARRRLEGSLKAGDPEKPGHAPRLARVHSLLGLIDLEQKDWNRARRHFADARALLLDPSEQKAEVFLHEARLETESGRWKLALQALDESEAIALQIGSKPGLFAAALEKGNLALQSEKFPEAEAAYARAEAIASDPQDESLLARVHQNLGVLNLKRNEPVRAVEHLKNARRLLLFFGNAFERAMNLLKTAHAEASLGRFEKARELLRQADGLAPALAQDPEFSKTRAETTAALDALESGRTGLSVEALHEMHRKLPDALKIGFEDRPDYQRLVKGRDLKAEPIPKEPSMDILNQLNAIMRDLLTSSEVDDILSRILEGAMELSGAERGFLVTRDEQVRASRNLSKEFLKGNEFRMSLSAVRKAMETGETVVTDNAALDPRFKNAASVQELELKAICVLPLKTQEGVIGVLYLDHRYQPLLFRDDDVKFLQMFADQAALAFQKARMIEEMKDEIVNLKKEVEEQRLQLTHEYAEIVGQSRPMMEVLSLVDRLIDSSIPVWIYGESGTGKEMVARALHFKGPRAKKQFVSENCSSLPETLLESELFGHKKGSFTHADRDKKGLLHHADGGTVFLDEIADMSAQLQAKLLRFLQEGEIRPVGSNEVIKVDVRVVSASNKDLNALVSEGKFREDLFYRLNGMTVTLPPLRDRVEDLPILVSHFLKKLALAEKKDPLDIVPEALDLLTEYSWPGNVRELENTIRSASLFHYKGKLLPKSFHFKKVLFGEASPSEPASRPAAAHTKASSALDEKRLLLQALKKTNFHKGEAAEELGISRRYLYTQLSKYRIPIKRMQMKAFVEKELG